MTVATASRLARKKLRQPAARPDPRDAAVVVEYCAPGNYGPVANELARAIENEFGVTVDLVPSRGGVFEVRVHGRLVFSKKATWRLPDYDEISYHLGSR